MNPSNSETCLFFPQRFGRWARTCNDGSARTLLAEPGDFPGMAQDQLRDAVESLRDAEDFVEDAEDREQLYAQAEALADVAGRDRSPDQTRLRGHHHTLRELHGRLNEDARVHLKDAMQSISTVVEAPP